MSTPPVFDRRYAARATVPVQRQQQQPPQPGQPGRQNDPRAEASLLTARPGPHSNRLPGRVWRTVTAAFTGTRKARELAEVSTALQLPLSTGRRVAVVSVHGGAGKSTLAAVMATLYATRRADPVLAADADPYEGSLSWRLGLSAHPSLMELAPRLIAGRGGDLRALEPLLPRTGSGLWVLPSGAPGQPKLATEVTRALSRLFAVCVTDCPPGIESWITSSVLPESHAVVIVSAATPDSVRATYRTLARVVDSGYASWLRRVVVVLNEAHGSGSDLRAMVANRFGVPVLALPYDRHLAGGGLIVPSRIGERTLFEATRIAGHALGRAWPL